MQVLGWIALSLATCLQLQRRTTREGWQWTRFLGLFLRQRATRQKLCANNPTLDPILRNWNQFPRFGIWSGLAKANTRYIFPLFCFFYYFNLLTSVGCQSTQVVSPLCLFGLCRILACFLWRTRNCFGVRNTVLFSHVSFCEGILLWLFSQTNFLQLNIPYYGIITNKAELDFVKKDLKGQLSLFIEKPEWEEYQLFVPAKVFCVLISIFF